MAWRSRRRSRAAGVATGATGAQSPGENSVSRKDILTFAGATTAALITVSGTVAVALINDDDPAPTGNGTDASHTPSPSPTTPSSLTPANEPATAWKVTDGTLTVTASLES